MSANDNVGIGREEMMLLGNMLREASGLLAVDVRELAASVAFEIKMVATLARLHVLISCGIILLRKTQNNAFRLE
jgi:hypothetical protein